eukprot:TRINITY_DN371_c0_g1_i1.p1 TRINITY_DN371_c0_g1~~TRINITY_DN371_c0_g1_i1.p1  ORF type:complete len:596 (-),score=100.07 TRINITY_DN371_c0_g1_i1:2001-3788(-)
MPFSEVPTKHAGLLKWVDEMAKVCKPEAVVWADGSDEEFKALAADYVKKGQCIALKKRPNSFLFRSDPRDVARVEARTFICTERRVDAGPTNHWEHPDKMKKHLLGLMNGCMIGRPMFVICFSMGPVGSDIASIGVELTDSPYVAMNMKIMTRMGPKVYKALGNDGFFVQCFHSVGCPITDPSKDVAWPCDPKNTFICHFPKDKSIWSYGSGYGGNALLGKKCYALRIASVMAKEQGWLAEHMLILGATSPKGERTYVTGAFPSQCGKTNFAMLLPPKGMEDWKITTVGDDIAWIKPHKDGYFHAINPENGFFGVCPGTNYDSNPSAMDTIRSDTIFTNVALTDDGDVWWESMEGKPKHLIDWRGNDWTPGCGRLAAHPNSRFTAPLLNCPTLDENWDNPDGVPIKAFIYGGRRMNDIPLVFQSFEWHHGCLLAATVSSEQTAAAEGKVGALRHDPMAMIPFCGYHMGDYWKHYVDIGKTVKFPPIIFHVNWFRKKGKKFLWPGFRQNLRALKWMLDRIHGHVSALYTPLGWMPKYEDFDFRGLKFTKEQWKELMTFDPNAIKTALLSDEALFMKMHDRVPTELRCEKLLLTSRL